MWRYILRRLLISIPILIGITIILFAILQLSPGDPLGIYAANPNLTPEVRAQIVAHYGLDQPAPVQYLHWAGGLVRGDWGTSFLENRPVTDVVLDHLPITLKIMGLSFLISLAIAIPLGILCAVRQHTPLGSLLSMLTSLGVAIPPFFSGLVLIIVIGVKLDWLPFIYMSSTGTTGIAGLIDRAEQLALPLLVLGFYQVGFMTRFVRSAMLEVLQLDYLRTGRAKGLPERAVILEHGFRNALIPVVTMVALHIPAMFTVVVIVEQLFAIPGAGSLLVTSVLSSDYLVVMGVVLVFAALTLICNLFADVAYAMLDPRITYS